MSSGQETTPLPVSHLKFYQFLFSSIPCTHNGEAFPDVRELFIPLRHQIKHLWQFLTFFKELLKYIIFTNTMSQF